jgi:phosphatidylglycerol:prolipoprotein diacylglycerol transferase
MILGGRLAYMLFYNLPMLMQQPASLFYLWEGGMSFHGGFIGVMLATYLFCRKNQVKLLPLLDAMSTVTPIGLFFGRIANFINAELYGRSYDGYFAMIFPTDPLQIPRHPSQLYEAMGEGVLLLCIMLIARKISFVKNRQGLLTGLCISSYAVIRMLLEQFRQPDEQLGFVILSLTMGQILSIVMLLFGVLLSYYLVKKC